jgi:simple sugar transport system ATP-binding protein/ribose transport system ATP-binding protein
MADSSHTTELSAIAIEVQHINKSFGATAALKDINLRIPRGSITGLVGENGAGKSTLGKIIAGVHSQDSGVLLVSDVEHNFHSPHDALNSGIALIAQEIFLVPDLTVEENIFLGDMPKTFMFPDKKKMRSRFDELVAQTGFDLNPDRKVSSLRLADQQKVEILRAICRNTQVIIMDEPSATLTADELQKLHQTIRWLASIGTTIILISHFLDEVLSLCDKTVVMRDGEVVRFGPTSAESVDTLVSAMVGRDVDLRYQKKIRNLRDNPVVLDVQGLNREGAIDNVSLQIRRGEILGLVGLVGSGRSEIARAIFGADPIDAGSISINGESVTIKHPQDAIKLGLFMIPESRKDQGLFLMDSILSNLIYSTVKKYTKSGFVSSKSSKNAGDRLATQIDLRFNNLDQLVQSLSGGNQQKILFGRSIDVDPSILIVDEPTRGVDIGAKRAIHKLLLDMNETGTGVLFISSEIEEALGVCDRVLVVHKGKVVTEFVAPFDQKKVIESFFSQSKEAVSG